MAAPLPPCPKCREARPRMVVLVALVLDREQNEQSATYHCHGCAHIWTVHASE